MQIGANSSFRQFPNVGRTTVHENRVEKVDRNFANLNLNLTFTCRSITTSMESTWRSVNLKAGSYSALLQVPTKEYEIGGRMTSKKGMVWK
jgi:hypothetical protein